MAKQVKRKPVAKKPVKRVVKKKTTTTRKPVAKKPIPKAVIEEVIAELDDLFELDEELDLDDILAENQDNDEEFIAKKNNADDQIKKADKDIELEQTMAFYKGIYLEYPQITDDFDVFSLKFRYFLLSQNVLPVHLTPRRMQRFIRDMGNMDTNEIEKVLKIVNL